MIWPNQVPISVVQNELILAFGAVARFGGWLLKRVLPTRRGLAGLRRGACVSVGEQRVSGFAWRPLTRRYTTSPPRVVCVVCKGGVLRRTIRRSSPRVRPGAPVLVWSSRWSLPGAARNSEGPLSPWSEFGSRETAHPAGTAGAWRVFEVAS